MIIKYKVYDQSLKIILAKKILNNILNDLKNLNSDKKLLFIYDKKIDEQVIKNFAINLKTSGCSVYFLELTGNKIHKSEKTLLRIIDFLISKKFTKNSVILSCCGGVIGDISSMASSLYLRGMIYLHIPTTITSIIDSCIGGKTGINYRGLINSLGTYYHAKSIYISEEILKKIPSREYYSGLPEIIKYGLIRKNSILRNLNNNQILFERRDFNFLSKLITESLKTKIHFFSKDVYEKNERLSLNFGHTFAHAIEVQNKYSKRINHGEAVIMGMMMATKLSYQKKLCSIQTLNEIEEIFIKNNLKYKIKSYYKKFEYNKLIKYMANDKKNNDSKINFILLKKIGETCRPNSHKISLNNLERYLNQFTQY